MPERPPSTGGRSGVRLVIELTGRGGALSLVGGVSILMRRPTWLGPFLVFLTCSVVVALLNLHHQEQQTNYWAEYVETAEYFRGSATRAVLTYPTWGYPAVLWLMPRYSWIVAVQVILGAAAMTWAYRRLLTELPANRHIVTLAFVAAVPWYALQSVKWPLSFASSLLLLAALTLDGGLRHSRILLGCLAGLLLGAVLYFRSEFLMIPVFLPLFYCLCSRRWLRWHEAAAFGVAALTALLLLLPWAVNYKRLTGRYSLTASQGGLVAFLSLGQLPANPWGAEYRDEYAFEYLAKVGVRTARYSDAGDRVLMEEYKRRVAEHPGAFARKVMWNGVLLFAGGFYNPEPRLDGHSNAAYESLRSALRSADPAGLKAPRPIGAWAAFLYWTMAKGLGAAYLFLSVVGILGWARRRDPSSVLLTLFAGLIVYQILFQMALATEPRYLNGIYLFAVPFFAISVNAALRRFGTARPARLRG